MTTLTCAGPTKPSIAMLPGAPASAASSRWAIAAGVSTWQHNTLKLASRCRSAARIASAVGGVVVSKPMARNTTSRRGFAAAIATASAADTTMRTSPPRALAPSRLSPAPAGTRSVSP